MSRSYLHRRYFARAVTDHPEDILHCQFGPSALAAYRSASMYIALMRDLCDLQPELPTRFVYVVFVSLLLSWFLRLDIALFGTICWHRP
jgi:hypothetical protein